MAGLTYPVYTGPDQVRLAPEAELMVEMKKIQVKHPHVPDELLRTWIKKRPPFVTTENYLLKCEAFCANFTLEWVDSL
eukprot:1385192-Prymnesium_polylepis.1